MSRAIALAALLVVSLAPPAGGAGPPRFDDAVVDSFARRYGEPARRRLLDWQALMGKYASRSGAEKRAHANAFFNRIEWVSDEDVWGVRDYWATPLEMLGRNQGDCEDYSIAKYFTLTEMDVPRGQLLITYVRATGIGVPHMVLAYYPTPDADPLILDNLDPVIRRGSQRSDLIPVYSFNADGLWQAIQRGLGRRAGAPTRLAMWNDLVDRMGAEGALARSKGLVTAEAQ